MGIRHDLQRSIQKVLTGYRLGSFATQANRKHILFTFAVDLVSKGFGLRDVQGLKSKHILAVVNHWQEKGLANSTIKNRTAILRQFCQLINKRNIIPSNKELKIGNRVYVPQRNRALHQPDFSKISNEFILVSMQLQRLFGLRREEALKIKPFMADKGDKLELQPTWCKGGRGRTIPIQTAEQRLWLDKAKALAEKFHHSLIPVNKSYIQHRNIYDKQALRAGLRNLHGLRHAYAQERYKILTGWESPINGGPCSKSLSKQEKEMDFQARMILTEELGHSREQITVNYLGR